MQGILKPIVYVSPFVIAAVLIGSNADTNWGAITIGFVAGCVVSTFWVALRKVVLEAGPHVRDAFREPVRQSAKPQKPVVARWRDVEGRELGVQEQIEAPRSVAKQ